MLGTGEAIHSDEVPGTLGTEVASDEERYRPDPLLEDGQYQMCEKRLDEGLTIANGIL